MSILTSCILGVILIAGGLLLRFYPLDHINDSLGYRTPFSMKNKDTWYEGNRFSGTIFLIGGLIFIPFSILVRYLYINNLTFSMRISLFAFFIIVMVTIIYTEIHLRMIFDKNGVKKLD
ncbi:hypothetical protein ACP49_13275 [Clostridium botulinum]|uniref:SdpI family protein n=1 Tax=Clostridium botulinum TaxID=1491 RepID=UPI0005F8FCBC|nr:SdpI family protein [Clostridium botulinum]KOM97991.1 hypothetical protein ACP53_08165 [Clostridium botulinum]KON01493.1 hypothetical protein ACP49_13275 [Clostridium botulinum]MBY7003770.1 SdpI family protein [Clostridium botulinum]MCR1145201.1 SdpI family protein [Clostridium botulinum]NFH93923.1 SdpI family protein [Clostridium botulinum]